MKALTLLGNIEKRIGELEEEGIAVKHLHISFLFGLFRIWNKTGRKQYFNVPRKVGMKSSGMSSKTTYYKVLSDVVSLGFITYTPNKMRKAPVFSFTTYNQTGPSSGTSRESVLVPVLGLAGPSSGTSTGTSSGTVLRVKNKSNKRDRGISFSEIYSLFNSRETEQINGLLFKLTNEELEDISKHLPSYIERVNKTKQFKKGIKNYLYEKFWRIDPNYNPDSLPISTLPKSNYKQL